MASRESVVKDLLRRLNAESHAPAQKPIIAEPSGADLANLAGGEAIAMAGLREAIQHSRALEEGLLEAVKAAKSLLLQKGSIGDKGLSALTRAFKEGEVSDLLHLDLSDNGITEQGFGALTQSLGAGVLYSLEHLDVSHNLVREEGSQMLARVLEIGRLPSLQHLNLSHCYIGDNGVKSLTNAMQSGHFSSWSLQSLDMSANVFGEEGVVALSRVFGMARLPYLKHLDLSFNMFGQSGASALASVLNNGQLSGLTHLFLSRCNLGDGVVPILLALEAGRVPNLQVLNISYNYMGDPGSMALGRALRSGSVSNLQHLVVSECGIPPGKIALIAEAIEAGKVGGLLRLDLSNNFSSPSTSAASFSAREVRSSRPDPGFLSLAGIIRTGHLSSLQYLNLSQCCMTDAGLIALAEEIEAGNLPKLQQFLLKDNDIRSERSIKALVRALESGHVLDLRELDLGHNSMGDDITMALASALEDSSEEQSPLVRNLKERLWSQKSPVENVLYQLLRFVEIQTGMKLMTRSAGTLAQGKIWNRYLERQSNRLIVDEQKESRRSNDKLVFNILLVCVWFLAVLGSKIYG